MGDGQRMPAAAQIYIRDFQAGDEPIFRELNEQWITRYFKMERADEEALGDPGGKILNRGGRILLAFDGDRGVGCCALLPMGAQEFEVAKMAVAESHRGQGIGHRLMSATIARAREIGATRLYIETNHTLAPAIRLYRSHGFQDLPAERVVQSPYARADVFMELMLTSPR
jgi:putative acetyltransferase